MLLTEQNTNETEQSLKLVVYYTTNADLSASCTKRKRCSLAFVVFTRRQSIKQTMEVKMILDKPEVNSKEWREQLEKEKTK